MPWAYEAYEEKPNSQEKCGVGERGGIIVCGLLPPSTDSFHRCGGPPPSKREVLGFRRSKPAALPSIGYRGFAVAPKPLRASSRSLLYNPGCRVETLLVSKGVMGFLGDLRGRNRNLPLIPLGLAERVPRPAGGGRSSQALEGVHPHRFYAEHPSIFRRTSGIRSTRST